MIKYQRRINLMMLVLVGTAFWTASPFFMPLEIACTLSALSGVIIGTVLISKWNA